MNKRTPELSQQEIASALDLLDSLHAAGIEVRRRGRCLEFSSDLSAAMCEVVRRTFCGLMFVVKCREETRRVLNRVSGAATRQSRASDMAGA